MTIYRATIPGQPFPKERPRVVKGRAYTPAKTQRAEDKVRVWTRHFPCLDGPVKLSLAFYRENAVPADIDNLAKLVQDALNGRAFKDDRQIVILSAVKAIDRENPRTEIEIEAVEPMEGVVAA